MAERNSDSLTLKSKELDQIWRDLRAGIEEMFRKRRVSKSVYMKLYTLVYRYCKNADALRQARLLRASRGSRKQRTIREQCAELKLYNRVKSCLMTYLVGRRKDSGNLTGERVLHFYVNQWERYEVYASSLDSVFTYFNRHWAPRHKLDGNYEIYHLTLKAWNAHMLKPLHHPVTNAVLKLVEKERSGKRINTWLVKKAIDTFRFLGLLEENSTARWPRLSVYKENFENTFLRDTETFYVSETSKFLSQNPVTVECVKKVKKCLLQDYRRVRRYVHTSTLKQVAKLRDKALIKNHRDLFVSEFQKLLDNDKTEDLGVIFRLLVRFRDILGQLKSIFETFITNRGRAAVERCGDSALEDPNVYAETLIELHAKYSALVTTAFNNDSRFVASLNSACSQFINNNHLTRLTGSSGKSPELLARYCNVLLRKSSKNVDDAKLMDTLNQVVTMLKYVEDKDVFWTFYHKLLACRLVQHTSISASTEAAMISRLQVAYGSGHTHKLGVMLRDVDVNRDLNAQFESHLKDSGERLDIGFTIQVFTSGLWPFQQSSSLALPPELETSAQRFTTFYRDRHSGRKVSWLHNVSEGELLTNCFRKRYTLKVSTLQMAVLLQYNAQMTFTVRQLQENTSIQQNTLIPVLRALLKFKLLACVDGVSGLHAGSLISLCSQYRNKNTRVNVNVSTKAELKHDPEVTRQHRKEERRLLVQAAVVRVMKRRKVLRHRQLLGEVLKQLSPQFKPRVSVVKDCIDRLIDKDYLERADGHRDTYRYVA